MKLIMFSNYIVEVFIIKLVAFLQTLITVLLIFIFI